MEKLKLNKQTLAQEILETINSKIGRENTADEETLFRVQTAGNHNFLCRVVEVGTDFMKVQLPDGHLEVLSLASGIGMIRDVTGEKGFAFAVQ